MFVLGLVALHAVEETEASHTHDGLDGEVTVVGEVAREIIGTELVLGILTVLQEVLDPVGQGVPVGLGEGDVPLGDGGGGDHHQHIAALLHGHLHMDGVVAVDLAVDQGVPAAVVGSEVKGPGGALGVLEDGAGHALDQLGVVEQEQGDGGVGDVYRGGTAVGEALLGDEQHLALGIHHALVGGDGLAVGQREHFGVLHTACAGGVAVELVREGIALIHDGAVLDIGALDGGLDGLAVLVPDRGKGLAEVLNGGAAVVVGQQEEGITQIAYGDGAHDVGHLVLLADEVVDFTLGSGEVEVAPLDAEIVSRAVQGGLVGLAHPDGGHIGYGKDLSFGGIVPLLVHDELLGGQDRGGDGVILAVHRLVGQGDIAHGAGHEGEIVGEKRGGEADGEVDLPVGEHVGGGQGGDVHRDLLHLGAAVADAHEELFLAVHRADTDEGVVGARPMLDGDVVEAVGHGPDREVGVNVDEGVGGSAELHGMSSFHGGFSVGLL